MPFRSHPFYIVPYIATNSNSDPSVPPVGVKGTLHVAKVNMDSNTRVVGLKIDRGVSSSFVAEYNTCYTLNARGLMRYFWKMSARSCSTVRKFVVIRISMREIGDERFCGDGDPPR